jgi:antirestriction protein ArdC
MRAHDLFQHITDQLIADIEAGAGDWHMPWRTLADAGTPGSVDGRRYRGMNALWLAMTAADQGWVTGTWATYRAWQRHGAQVRRGERGTPVVLWKEAAKRATSEDESDERSGRGRRMFAKAYSVFAAEQVDGADDLIAARAARLNDGDTPERLAAADAYFTGLGFTVIEGGSTACYVPAKDRIHIPVIEQFDRAASYYATRAHESIHATGHRSRLGRDLIGRFGSDAYAAEELVAELGAAMWCAQAGVSSTTRHDHAAYLSHWLDILRQDPRSLVSVASKAQAAVDHLNTTTTHPLPSQEPAPA